MTSFLLVMELIGTAAFAASGAMIGIRQRMDLFGVCVLGLLSACGGGLLRDVFLGKLPPALFCDPVYALAAIVVSVVLFLPSVYRLLAKEQKIYDKVLLITDAVGLGIFTAAGVSATVHAGFGGNFIFCVFLGTITGVGGGVMRDTLAGLPPYIFVKHIYACGSILGAILCRLLWAPLGETASVLICCAVVILVRLLAAHFRWSLPKAKGPVGVEK